MRLLELCLLSLLSPQDPTPAPAPAIQPGTAATTPATPTPETTTPTTPASVTPATAVAPAAVTPAAVTPTAAPTQEPAAILAAAERAGEAFDGDALVKLTHGDDAAVAEQATMLLARTKKGAGTPFLQQIVASCPHATPRALAMQALLKSAEVGCTSTAIQALDDADRRVRALAAQTLGKLRRPAAVEPLLALVDRSRTTTELGVATDVQAALLALHDLGAADKLLRAATAVHDGSAQGTGEALAYCLQQLSSKLPRGEELTLLLAVLGHRELLVRRFAIGRLAELGEPSAAAALEGRLGKEDDSLRPLLEVALAQLRRDHLQPQGDELARAEQNARALAKKATQWWLAATPVEQGLVAGTPIALLLVTWALGRRRRRLAAAAEAATLTAMVAPSEEYAEQVAAEAAELVAAAEEVAHQDAEQHDAEQQDAEPQDGSLDAEQPAEEAAAGWQTDGEPQR